jgi:hypothetical protein
LISDRVSHSQDSDKILEVEFKFIFVGNSDDSKYDQELDVIAMPGLEFGESEFEWEVGIGIIFSVLNI